MDRVSAYIGLGSNLNNPLRQLRRAIARLQQMPATQVQAVSSYYRSLALPVPGRSENEPQPDFINAVAEISTALPAKALLSLLLRIEQQQGRQRHYRWAPRSLDLDILLYGRQRLATPGLHLPHPELWRRAFVLYPLHDIAPHIQIPGYGSVQTLMRHCDRAGLKRLTIMNK